MDKNVGLLVLGMHRSGTSALARMLNLGGADLGMRVLGASSGNEAGHWEDAFAVETHERLLVGLGARWDEPFAVPREFACGNACREATAQVAVYVEQSRMKHQVWAVKDPRLSLFGGLWVDAGLEAGADIGAIVMLRHPTEVAASLAARDGIGPGQAALLWLDYTHAAAALAERVPHCVVHYDALLDDWRAVAARIRALPGAEKLDFAHTQEAVDGFLDAGSRHHRIDEPPTSPLVAEVWAHLCGAAKSGTLRRGTAAWIEARLQPVRDLLAPYAQETRLAQRQLWERIGRAEAHLTDSGSLGVVRQELAELRERTDRHRDDLVQLLSDDSPRRQIVDLVSVQLQAQTEKVINVYSSDIREMQRVAADAIKRATESERDVALLGGLMPRVDALTEEAARLGSHFEHSAEAARLDVSGLQARLQEAIETTRLESAGLQVRLEEAIGTTRLESQELRARLDHQGQSLITLLSDDIRRMQDVAAGALEQAAAHQREATIAMTVLPEVRLVAETARQEAGELRSRIDHQGLALTALLSSDIRTMQEAVASARADAEAARREADIARFVAPALEVLVDGSRGLDSAFEDMRHQFVGEIRARAASVATRVDRSEQAIAARMEALAERIDRSEKLRTERDALQADVHATHTRCDQLQRELAQLRRDHAAAIERAAELDMIKRSASWTVTRPLRVLKRLATGRWSPNDSDQLRRLLRLGVRKAPLTATTKQRLVEATLSSDGARPDSLPDAAMAPLVRLAEAQARVPDVFVWAVIDWRFRTQRPQHLACALAEKGHRVFYISNNFIDSAEPGFGLDPLDIDGRLFQVHLHLQGAPAIYFDMPTDAQVEQLRASLAELLGWSCTLSSLSLVQHPYWTPLIRAVPSARVVYDCMDHHAGFLENAPAVLAAEHALVRGSDLVVVTSDWLENEIAPQARATALVRNAGEYEFFRHRPERTFRDELGRRVIGYYGAIADWFDTDLVRAVAQAFPDALVLLVGDDTTGAGNKLADLPNVRLVGEVPYADLPYWLYGFDLCLLPFRVIPLTLATNPVKVYEYLSAGKAVVSVDLPELRQFGDLVKVASDTDGFVRAIGEYLQSEPDTERARARQAFASEQTWAHRAAAFDAAIATLPEPRVSVIVLTYNNLAFTEACLFSIEAYSDYSDLEVIVVDNASSDGSREWLEQWAATPSVAGHARRLILNEENLGFSAGNNVGLRAATGEYLVILNNDTYVTPGWVRTLCNHFRDTAELGLVGPVTNNIGNEARIDIGYADMGEMIARAATYTRAHPGGLYPLRTAAFFCVAMPRSTFEAVGDMDERFGVGFFEDDDYCRRAERLGLRIACAEDVFVHHHLSASFDQLRQEMKQELFQRNKAIYEEKWGTWAPHEYRH